MAELVTTACPQKIWVYALCYNEERLLPFFLRHYATIATRIIIYDHGSNDKSLSILARHQKVEVRRYPGLQAFDDIDVVSFCRRQYREARSHADWVIWVDMDEFVYHPKLATRLDEWKSAGVTVPLTQGYQMLSDSFPTGDKQIYSIINTGVPDNRYSKMCLFDPSIHVTFAPGRHRWTFQKPVVYSEGREIKLLHYRFLGEDFIRERNAKNHARFSPRNIFYGHGGHNAPAARGTYDLDWFKRVSADKRDCINLAEEV